MQLVISYISFADGTTNSSRDWQYCKWKTYNIADRIFIIISAEVMSLIMINYDCTRASLYTSLSIVGDNEHPINMTFFAPI